VTPTASHRSAAAMPFDVPSGATCALCGTLLAGYVLRDSRGRYLCGTHEPQLAHCRFCTSAFIPGAHSAAADRCARCASRAVSNPAEAEVRLSRIMRWFAKHGLALPLPLPTVTLRDRMPIAPDGMPMLGFVVKPWGDRVVMQRGLPPEVFLTVAVHELTHIWLLRAGARLAEPIEEGMCNWLAWHFARELGSADGQWQAHRTELRDDPVYGAWFRKIRSLGDELGPRDLPAMLRRLSA
jgi:hypothetical protein